MPPALRHPAAPNPLTYFLGSLVGCTQYTIHMISKEMKLPPIARIAWEAEGEYDLRGVRGEPGVDARWVTQHSTVGISWQSWQGVRGMAPHLQCLLLRIRLCSQLCSCLMQVRGRQQVLGRPVSACAPP